MLIGIHGAAGAGKDTAGNYLVTNYNFVKRAFATPIKQMLSAIGIHEPDRDAKENVMPEWGFSYRRAAQLLGTEWGRKLHDEIWINAMQFELRMLALSGQSVVITDVRFENEASMIRAKGGIIIHLLDRSYDTAADSVKPTWWDRLLGRRKHKSEAGIEVQPDDWIITNSGTLKDLYDKLDNFIASTH